MKIATINVTFTVTAPDETTDTELQSIAQQAHDSAQEAVDTTPNAENITITFEPVSGEITETRPFTLQALEPEQPQY